MQLVRLGPRCNNACVFCAQAVERPLASSPWVGPSLEELDGLFDAAQRGGEPVAFVGGEPTLHHDLPAWIRRAAQRGVGQVVLQTNARRLSYAAYAEQLRAAGLRAVDVTLLGSTVAMHDYHTDTPGSFQQTVRGMRNARLAGLAVVATCLITRSNFRHLPELVRVAHLAGASSIRLRLPVAVGRAVQTEARVLPRAELVEPYVKLAQHAAKSLRFQAFLIGSARDAQAPFVDFLSDDATALREPRDAATTASSDEQVLRARPATTERRVRDRLTGAELQEILPDLFSPAGGR